MRQEDAHEYLRQLLDCMHEEVLKSRNVKTCDGKIAETTLISRVFGGYLLSELKCSNCKYSSKTFNHFQDLSLEVSEGISSGIYTIVDTLVPIKDLAFSVFSTDFILYSPEVNSATPTLKIFHTLSNIHHDNYYSVWCFKGFHQVGEAHRRQRMDM